MQRLMIVSGPINSGKSTYLHRLIDHYEQQGLCVGGVTAEALFEGERKCGYDVRDVRTGVQTALVRSAGVGGDKGEIPNFEVRLQRVGRFYILESGLEFTKKVLEAGFDCDLLCLDEVGPLEMQGGGHSPALKMLLAEYHGTLLLVAREAVVDALIGQANEYGWEIVLRYSGVDF
ncbi:MAG: nucleoside-triphosphatase [Spirochaetota bacterium]